MWIAYLIRTLILATTISSFASSKPADPKPFHSLQSPSTVTIFDADFCNPDVFKPNMEVIYCPAIDPENYDWEFYPEDQTRFTDVI